MGNTNELKNKYNDYNNTRKMHSKFEINGKREDGDNMQKQKTKYWDIWTEGAEGGGFQKCDIELIAKIKENSIKTLPEYYPKLAQILPKCVLEWSVVETSSWLSIIGVTSLFQKFKQASIDGSCILLLNQRDLYEQMGIKSSITIGIIMAWVEYGFKEYEKYLEYYNSKKERMVNGRKNIERMEEIIKVIKNIEIEIPLKRLANESKYPNKNQHNYTQQSIIKSHCKNRKPEISLPYSLVCSQKRGLKISDHNISASNISKPDNTNFKLENHTFEQNQNSQSCQFRPNSLQIFDKSTNICIRVSKFPYNIIEQLDRVNNDYFKYYYIPSSALAILNNKNVSQYSIFDNESDDDDMKLRINKNQAKCKRKTLRQELSQPVYGAKQREQKWKYAQQWCLSQYYSNISSTINSFENLYHKDMENAMIIITKSQNPHNNNLQYYLSFVIKTPIQLCKDVDTYTEKQLENIQTKKGACKRYQYLQTTEQQDFIPRYYGQDIFDKDYNYYRSNSQDNGYEYDYGEEQETYDNEFAKKAKKVKNIKEYNRKTQNKFSKCVNNNNYISNSNIKTTKMQSNNDINVYYLLKQPKIIPQNYYNTFSNESNNNFHNSWSKEEYYGNRFKFVINQYQFIPQFYQHIQQNAKWINMVLTTIGGKIKLTIQPNRIFNYHHNYVQNYDYIYATSEYYSLYFICVDPFTKYPILQQPNPGQSLEEYINGCSYDKLASIIYFKAEKQYYLCNNGEVQWLIRKKMKEIQREKRHNQQEKEIWMMGQDEEQIYMRKNRIGKNKGDKKTRKQSQHQKDTPIYRYGGNGQQYSSTNFPENCKIWVKLPLQTIELSSSNLKGKSYKSFQQQQLLKIEKLLQNRIRIRNNCTLKIGSREIVFNINVRTVQSKQSFGNLGTINEKEYNNLNRHVQNIIQSNFYNDSPNSLKQKSNYQQNSYSCSNKCILCYAKPNNCIYLDCRHNVTCLSCGKMLENCPICRKPINDYVRLYI